VSVARTEGIVPDNEFICKRLHFLLILIRIFVLKKKKKKKKERKKIQLN